MRLLPDIYEDNKQNAFFMWLYIQLFGVTWVRK